VILARGPSIQRCARILGVPESSFYEQRSRTPSVRSVRHAWPTDLIGQVHTDARGVYGSSQGARETHEGAGDQGEPEHRGASYATREYSGQKPDGANELNIRPRKGLNWDTPAERLDLLLKLK